jgi:hypothetical protein
MISNTSQGRGYSKACKMLPAKIEVTGLVLVHPKTPDKAEILILLANIGIEVRPKINSTTRDSIHD